MNKTPFRLRPVPFKIIAFWTCAKRRIASESLTAWLGVVFTLALAGFTYKLALVASMQTEILAHTDKALHLAATAQTASAQTAEKLRLFTEAIDRAWIGPVSARSEPFEAGKPIKITVFYNNTGRLLASFEVVRSGKFYTKEEWNDGRASASVGLYEANCMSGLPNLDQGSKFTGVAYPTTGLTSYTLFYNSNNPNTPEKDRLVLTKELVADDLIYVFFGCFVYKTGESSTHHSFFCYFHQAGISEELNNNLAYCPFGQRAD